MKAKRYVIRGHAGVIASIAIAIAGIAVGAFAAFVSQYGVTAEASRTENPGEALRDSRANVGLVQMHKQRDEAVQRAIAEMSLERLSAPSSDLPAVVRPQIYIIIDDMGLDPKMVDAVAQLPGPLTLSFLPYARNVNALAQRARRAGAELMLHLPMEPQGTSDPGPRALKSGSLGSKFISDLEWNLSRFDGYVGVNNHMGSKLTTDVAAMRTVLGYLKSEGLFFVDSVTTGETAVGVAAARIDMPIIRRDVFLDAETGSVEAVRKQLLLVERVAIETGFAVAIGHPRSETLEVLGPWLTTAPARGFDIRPVSALAAKSLVPAIKAAPSLRS